MLSLGVGNGGLEGEFAAKAICSYLHMLEFCLDNRDASFNVLERIIDSMTYDDPNKASRASHAARHAPDHVYTPDHVSSQSNAIHAEHWISDSEEAAECMGVPTLRLKLIATTISGAMMGVAGAPLASYLTFIDPLSAFNLSMR